MGMGGEIFVFDMGDPVKIAQLARQMITLSGYEPDKDIQIEYTGLRPGEKLYEELLTDQEKLLPTYNAKLKVAQVDRLEPKFVLEQVHRLLHSYQLNSEEELVEKIAAIVPEFDSSNERFAQRKNGSNGQQAALVEL
jgi:FlaA1/EpsC-like NDP-sugar epimerase